MGEGQFHNLRFWGSKNPHAVLEHARDSPKINVFCARTNRHVFGPFFFAENRNRHSLRRHVVEWLMPQLKEKVPDFVFQQDGAPPHWHNSVRDEHLLKRWIGRAGVNDLPFLMWPPRSSDLTPCDFYLWGYVKDTFFKILTLDELKQLIYVLQSMPLRLICCNGSGGNWTIAWTSAVSQGAPISNICEVEKKLG
nr:unnamed protein product [Callosobruchus chinensis]